MHGRAGLVSVLGYLPLNVPYLRNEQDGRREEDDEDPPGGQNGRGAEGLGDRAGDRRADRSRTG